MEFERETALGQVINPSYLVCAARAITQAATNANNATGSGKTSEIGLAGDMIRRAAEELVRRLHSVLQTSLSSVSVSKDNASWRKSTNPSNTQEVLSNGVVRESGSGNTLDDCSESICYPALEKICQRAIHGSASTMSELKQLVEHMNKVNHTYVSFIVISLYFSLLFRQCCHCCYCWYGYSSDFHHELTSTPSSYLVLVLVF